jgi:hypothetical protein
MTAAKEMTSDRDMNRGRLSFGFLVRARRLLWLHFPVVPYLRTIRPDSGQNWD